MPTITYIDADGREILVDAAEGMSVMEAATLHGLSGIVAECGGAMMCATCHVYVDEHWVERVGGPSEGEDEMLDGTAAERRPNSRLSCQIEVTPDLDGLVVRTPERQT
jgi:ferredoxin, 2Fe-2S